MSISEWITDHESVLSGLATIAALLGLAGAVARLLRVRARDPGERTGASARVRMLGIGAAACLAIAVRVFLNAQPDAPEPGPDRAGPPTIAVFPLTTMSGVAEHEWLSDGMTEDIIMLLARSPALRVIARNSTFQYKGQSVNIREVGEGSLRLVGDRIRVTAQLIDVGLGTPVWAKKYVRPLADIFALQDEVTTAIAAGVGDELFKVETYRATQASSDNLDAWSQTWRADITYSIDDARKAIALDENYGRAHAVLGRNIAVSLHEASTDAA